RLNELGYLPKLERISSVSGGSITAGVLGLHWSALAFGANGVAKAFNDLVVAPIRDLAGRTLDAKAIIGGTLLPGTIADKVAAAYDKYLFHGATIQSLPQAPRFVINATDRKSTRLNSSHLVISYAVFCLKKKKKIKKQNETQHHLHFNPDIILPPPPLPLVFILALTILPQTPL